MHWYNKVAWSEGLFLRPQLFQQQERYLEQFAHRRAAQSGPFFWGFSMFHIDEHALALGKVGLSLARGLFADGTPFDLPEETLTPPPLAIGQEHVGQAICLAIQGRQAGTEETLFDTSEGGAASLARSGVFDADVHDSNSVGQGTRTVQLSRLRLRVVAGTGAVGGWLPMAFTRVAAIQADGSVTLDRNFIAPVRGAAASTTLFVMLNEVYDICRMRAVTLAERLSASDGRAHESAEVADFLMLQLLNRAEVSLKHLLQVPETSPEQFYILLAGIAAELATFARPETRRPPEFERYLHGGLNGSFVPLITGLRGMLNEVLVRSARLIPLEDRPNNVRFANLGPAELAGFSSLVFAVAAQMPADRVASEFPQQSKVAPFDRLSEVIRAHVPGIPLQVLPVPPRQIPFNSGFVYFQLEPHGALWEHLLVHGGLGLHMGALLPGLRLQLWGVSKK